MTRTPSTTGSNPSDNLSCPHCHTQLPSHTVFCSRCGKRVEKGKNGEGEKRPANDEDAAQEWEVDTVRIRTLSRVHLPSLPVTPAPPMPGAWQHIPETDASDSLSEDLTAPSIPVPDIDTKKPGAVPFSQHMKQRITRPLSAASDMLQRKIEANQSKSNWLWPTIIILSAVAAGLVNFVFTDTAIRPIVVFWFLFVCPGMVLVRFLRLNQPVVEWTLALALSFAIDAILAAIQLYAGRWSPAGTLVLLMSLCLCGAIVQLATGTLSVPTMLHAARSWKPAILLPVLLTLLVSIIVGTSLWSSSYEVSHGSRSVTSTSAPPHKAAPHPSPNPTIVPTPSSTFSAIIAESYYGTVYDIPASVNTEMSLTGIQQTRITISGNFTGLHRTGTFEGLINPSKHIQFTVKDSTGRLILSFDGDMQSDGELSGSYCSVDQDARCTGEYGLWSVTPGS